MGEIFKSNIAEHSWNEEHRIQQYKIEIITKKTGLLGN